MLAVLWIAATREAYSFPTLLKGSLSLQQVENTISLTLRGVTRYTWEDHHGRPIPAGESEKILWQPHDDVAYCNLRLEKTEICKVYCRTEDGTERICVQFLSE